MPIVVLDYSMANGFFASTMRGLGYGGQAGAFSYSVALGYRGERDDHRRKGLRGLAGSDYLKGMGKVEGNASAMLNLGYSPLPGMQLSVASDIPLTHRENGATVQFGASGQVYSRKDSRGMPQDSISLGLQAGWGEKKYLQTMYGVTQAQAARTAFRQYTPKGWLLRGASERQLGTPHRCALEPEQRAGRGTAPRRRRQAAPSCSASMRRWARCMPPTATEKTRP